MAPSLATRLERLRTLGRAADGLQVFILLTMGQYLYSNTVVLSSPQWKGFRDFLGGEHMVGGSVIAIGLVGLIGIFSLAVTKTDTAYQWIMTLFTLLAVGWCWTVAGFQTYVLIHDHAGNAGLWNWGMAGLFFAFSRLAILLASNTTPYATEAPLS